MVARAAKSSIRVNGENGLASGLVASDGTLEERYEYTPYGERTRKAGGELPLTPALSRKLNVPPGGGRGRGRCGGGRRKSWREARFIRRGSPIGSPRGESGWRPVASSLSRKREA